jgi:NADP-dependent 3-hydroxy acid dehydrogenase YdfG
MVDINLRGLMYVTKAALPQLLKTAQSSSRSVADVVNISSVAGRVAAPTVALYNATKYAVTGATESWRQEYTTRNLRFSVIEPGRTSSELFDQKANSDADFTAAFGKVEALHAEDIAHAIAYVVTSPRRVAINEIVIRPTDQP